MEAGPDYLAFFFDGAPLANYTAANTPNLQLHPEPNFLVINTAIGDWGPMPSATTVFPGHFDVEYVRVAVKKPPAAA